MSRTVGSGRRHGERIATERANRGPNCSPVLRRRLAQSAAHSTIRTIRHAEMPFVAVFARGGGIDRLLRRGTGRWTSVTILEQ